MFLCKEPGRDASILGLTMTAAPWVAEVEHECGLTLGSDMQSKSHLPPNIPMTPLNPGCDPPPSPWHVANMYMLEHVCTSADPEENRVLITPGSSPQTPSAQDVSRSTTSVSGQPPAGKHHGPLYHQPVPCRPEATQ